MSDPLSLGAFEALPLTRNRVEQVERDLKKWAEKTVTFAFEHGSADLFEVRELSLAFAKRFVDIAGSIRTLVEADRIVPAAILARALIETIGMGCLFLHDMSRLIEMGDAVRLKNRLFRYYAGVKGTDAQRAPVHVMDAIRHLEELDRAYFAYLDQKYGITSIFEEIKKTINHKTENKDIYDALSVVKNYDFLSEVAHPNGTGTQFIYPDGSSETRAVGKFRDRLRNSCLAAIWQGHHLLSALEKNADLPERFRIKFIDGSS